MVVADQTIKIGKAVRGQAVQDDPSARLGKPINGVPIEGHTGVGSVTDQAIRKLLALQGSMAPTQIIGPISYRDQSTTLALPSHDNRIQILFGSSYGSNGKASKQVASILKPGQWTTLINRLSEIPEPVVPVSPSRYAIRQPAH